MRLDDPDLIRTLAGRELTVTTIEKDDARFADRLQNAFVGGGEDLLHWRVGPEVQPGAFVAIYTTDSIYLPKKNRRGVQRIYTVAVRTRRGRKSGHWVYLHRPVTVDPPLLFAELTQPGDGIWRDSREIQNLGRKNEPLPIETRERFWRLVLRGRPHLIAKARELLAVDTGGRRVAISFAGEDWMQGQRLKIWCEENKLNPFFVTSVGRVEKWEEPGLRRLLRAVFSEADLAVFLVPKAKSRSRWINLELAAARQGRGAVLLVRPDPTADPDHPRKWPCDEEENVVRRELKPAHEKELIREMKSLLRRAKALAPPRPE